MNRRMTFVLLVALFAPVPQACHGHDFWLVPVAFRVDPGDTVQVLGQMGMVFPKSIAAVDPARVAEAHAFGSGEKVPLASFSQRDSSLILRFVPNTPGQYTVALRSKWRYVPESAESFLRYFDLEGAGALRERYEHEGVLPTDSLVRRYAKYAKTLIEVGTGPRAFGTVVGHPLEFVHLSDPSAASRGDTLRLRLLFAGIPLAGAVVHAGAAPAHGHPEGVELLLQTSTSGEVAIPLMRSGLWNARSLHVVPAAKNEDADWDVHWASAVFEVTASKEQPEGQ